MKLPLESLWSTRFSDEISWGPNSWTGTPGSIIEAAVQGENYASGAANSSSSATNGPWWIMVHGWFGSEGIQPPFHDLFEKFGDVFKPPNEIWKVAGERLYSPRWLGFLLLGSKSGTLQVLVWWWWWWSFGGGVSTLLLFANHDAVTRGFHNLFPKPVLIYCHHGFRDIRRLVSAGNLPCLSFFVRAIKNT